MIDDAADAIKGEAKDFSDAFLTYAQWLYCRIM
jgi:hypothetical protein